MGGFMDWYAIFSTYEPPTNSLDMECPWGLMYTQSHVTSELAKASYKVLLLRGY